jgi:toxin ParE1/3/4
MARADLIELIGYLEDRFGTASVRNFIDRIEEFCLSLGSMPNRGTAHFDLRPGLRTVGFERRVTIAFRVKSDSVAILRILYGGRSVEKAFRPHRR